VLEQREVAVKRCCAVPNRAGTRAGICVLEQNEVQREVGRRSVRRYDAVLGQTRAMRVCSVLQNDLPACLPACLPAGMPACTGRLAGARGLTFIESKRRSV
jgi:hypothetical protein